MDTLKFLLAGAILACLPFSALAQSGPGDNPQEQKNNSNPWAQYFTGITKNTPRDEKIQLLRARLLPRLKTLQVTPQGHAALRQAPVPLIPYTEWSAALLRNALRNPNPNIDINPYLDQLDCNDPATITQFIEALIKSISYWVVQFQDGRKLQMDKLVHTFITGLGLNPDEAINQQLFAFLRNQVRSSFPHQTTFPIDSYRAHLQQFYTTWLQLNPQPAQTQPAQTQPAQTQPAQTQPAQTQPAQPPAITITIEEENNTTTSDKDADAIRDIFANRNYTATDHIRSLEQIIDQSPYFSSQLYRRAFRELALRQTPLINGTNIQLAVILQLLNLNAPINTINVQGTPILHVLARNVDFWNNTVAGITVAEILQQNLDTFLRMNPTHTRDSVINIQNPYTGDTALHVALENGNNNAVQWLLDNGANLTIANQTPEGMLRELEARADEMRAQANALENSINQVRARLNQATQPVEIEEVNAVPVNFHPVVTITVQHNSTATATDSVNKMIICMNQGGSSNAIIHQNNTPPAQAHNGQQNLLRDLNEAVQLLKQNCCYSNVVEATRLLHTYTYIKEIKEIVKELLRYTNSFFNNATSIEIKKQSIQALLTKMEAYAKKLAN